LKYKEGDQGRFALHAETTDKLLVFASNGRFYTIGCDKLPGGRGLGEPLRLMIDLPEGFDAVAMFIHKPGAPPRRLVVASDKGRGFVVAEADVIAQTRNGKQVLNLAEGEKAAAACVVGDAADHLAVLGHNRKLLIFPLAELPVMARGRGVILQRYKTGGLADLATLKAKEGLTWRAGQQGVRSEPDVRRWTGKRAQAGLKVPKGFARANRF
jgi:topoisomerase-4 subunit A